MPKPEQALKPCLRIAAALALAMAMSPSFATADDPECAEPDIAKRYTEIETSLGTIGLCLVDDDDTNSQVTAISRAFLTAARQGVFANSFFHRSNTCGDEGVCSETLRGGRFRLTAGEIDGVPDTAAWQIGAVNVSGFGHTEGSIAVVRDMSNKDYLTGEWFINLQDNHDELKSPPDAYEVFGLVVSGMDVVYEIADLATVDTPRPPSRLHVRYAESACLSGEAPDGTPEAALEDCPCPEGVGDEICKVAGEYRDTVPEADLWVRVEDDVAPCISGDDSGTDPCNCGETDLCIKAETYRGTLAFYGYPLFVAADADPEPCISGDQSEAKETCECIEPYCVDFDSYLSGFESQLYVKLPTPACISGDDETELCQCPEEDQVQGGPCVRFDDYLTTSPPDLEVYLAHPACLSGDAPAGAIDSCVCRAIDLDPGIARCVAAEEYAEGYPDLLVRDEEGFEPCLSGDDDDDETACACGATDPCVQAVCSEPEIQGPTTCESASQGYLHSQDEYGSFIFTQEVWPGREACLSGDEPGSETCTCGAEDDCVDAESYLEELFVRVVEGETPCIHGDDPELDETCTCTAADKWSGICVAGTEYVSGYPDLSVRLAVPPCIGTDHIDGDDSCPCEGVEPACEDAGVYLQDVLGLGDDSLVPLIDPGPDPILDINSSTLVLIPEPSSAALEAAALVALALLARVRRRRSSCERL